jgi:membrane protease YdiL (CAAX protease family)
VERPLSTPATIVATLVVVAVLAWSATRESPVDWSLDQVGATIQMIERSVEIADAADRAKEGPWKIFGMAEDSPAKARDRGIKRYYRAADRLETLHRAAEERTVRAHLAYLLSDAGRRREAALQLRVLRQFPEMRGLCDAIAALDADSSTDGDRIVDPEVATPLRKGWAATRLKIRLLDRAGRRSEAGELRASALQSGRARFFRMTAVEAAGALLFYIGTMSVVFELRYEAWRPPIPPHPTRSRWTVAQGLGVFARSELAGLLLAFGIAGIGCTGPFSGLCLWDALVCFLPLVWLVRRHLVSGPWRDVMREFRMLPAGLAATTLLRISLGLLAIVWIAGPAIEPISKWLGVDADLTAVYFDPMVMDTPPRVALAGVNAVIWAPLAEEVTFRGLLYLTLRTIVRPGVAALASALLFAEAHLYSPAASLPVLWTGLVFAFGFERYRSLLPGLVCHALMNLFFIVSNVVAYR